MQTKVAHLPDGPVRYLESGSGRTIVLLHAFPLSADQYLPQLHRLPPGWRAVAPDLRGFRGATASFAAHLPEGATLDDYAADVLSLMTHLEIDRAVIAGVSMGGYIAFSIFRRAAGRVAGLLLANTRATADSAEGLAGRDRMIALAQREGAAGVAKDMVPKLLGECSRRDQPDLVEMIRRMIEANPVDALVLGLRAMKQRFDSTTLLPTIGCQTVVIGGEEDAVISRAELEAMALNIPGARTVLIPRAGHLTNLEAPAAFNEAMTQLLLSVNL
jgi:pimeloyl-ACP methyl ester carboxylesterase